MRVAVRVWAATAKGSDSHLGVDLPQLLALHLLLRRDVVELDPILEAKFIEFGLTCGGACTDAFLSPSHA